MVCCGLYGTNRDVQLGVLIKVLQIHIGPLLLQRGGLGGALPRRLGASAVEVCAGPQQRVGSHFEQQAVHDKLGAPCSAPHMHSRDSSSVVWQMQLVDDDFRILLNSSRKLLVP